MTQEDTFPDFAFNSETVIMEVEVRPPKERFLENPLPSSTDSEKVILGAIIVNNDLMESVVQVLRPEDFYSPLYRRIFRAMIALFQGLSRIDTVLIAEELKKTNSLEAIGGLVSIASLTHGLPWFDNVDDYLNKVHKKAVARNLVKTCNEIISIALSEDEEVEVTTEYAEQRILAVVSDLNRNASSRDREGFYALSELTAEMKDQFERYNRGETSGVSTGMKEVDDLLDGGGLQKKGLYVVGGAEKSGKTSCALDWGFNVSTTQGLISLIVTAEMARTTLAKRIYSAYTGIPFFFFRPGFRDSSEDKAYTRAIDSLDAFGKIPIRISDNLRTTGQIRRHFRRAVEQGHKKGGAEVGLGIVDYLQLIELDGLENNQKRVDVVSKISRELKLLATELDIPIVVMSSLNRLGLTEGEIPDTFNLRDSGTIGFDAEAVFFLHNPAYIPGKEYVPQEVTPINLILSRQRNGPTGIIPLMFVGKYMAFMTASQWQTTQQGGGVAARAQAEEEFNSLWENTR